MTEHPVSKSTRHKMPADPRTSAPNRQEKLKRIVNKAFVILFLLQALGIFLPPRAHRILGILFCVLVVIHCIEHRKWFMALCKGRYSQKRKQITAENLSLFASIFVLVLCGFFIPGTTHTFLDQGIYSVAGKIHIPMAVISLVLLCLHVRRFFKRNSKRPISQEKNRNSLKRLP